MAGVTSTVLLGAALAGGAFAANRNQRPRGATGGVFAQDRVDQVRADAAATAAPAVLPSKWAIPLARRQAEAEAAAAEREAQKAAKNARKPRGQGRSSTILTGPGGALGAAPVQRHTLLGS